MLIPKPSRGTKFNQDNEDRILLLKTFPCCACGAKGVQVHHINTGMGRLKDHKQTIPLCPDCHIGPFSIHRTKKAFEEVYGPAESLLDKTNALLARLTRIEDS